MSSQIDANDLESCAENASNDSLERIVEELRCISEHWEPLRSKNGHDLFSKYLVTLVTKFIEVICYLSEDFNIELNRSIILDIAAKTPYCKKDIIMKNSNWLNKNCGKICKNMYVWQNNWKNYDRTSFDELLDGV